MRYFNLRKSLLILFLALTISLALVVDSYFSDALKIYIDQKSSMFVSRMLENTIRNSVLNKLNSKDLVYIETSGTIQNIIIDSQVTNQILADVYKNINEELENLENENYQLKIPVLGAFNKSFLASIGPKVNIEIMPSSSVKVDITSKITEYGINNSLLEMYIETDIVFNTYIPLRESEVIVNSRIPIHVQVLKGDVPKYYYRGGANIPNTPHDSDANGGDSEPDLDEPEIIDSGI